jgi:uncharacterized repeat protein (TIGR03843 family)
VSPLELTPEEIGEVLARGRVEVVARVRYSSNGTFLVEASMADVALHAVYKPRRGERPLWDFPSGTLCNREVAAHAVSSALGWNIVPVTVMRDDAPFGSGVLQVFVEHDPDEHYFTLLEHHADRFRQFAVFDVLVNNTDRKAGHCLRSRATGAVVGIDHGLTFHPVWKLRTVIWDFAGEAVPGALIDDVERVARDVLDGDLGRTLGDMLTAGEVAGVVARAEELVRSRRYPNPEPGYHSVPWPVV